jgi:hypothetical protein
MKINSVTYGTSFINVSVANVFAIRIINSITNTISIANSSATARAVVQNDQSISISNEPELRLPTYSFET